MSTSNSTSKVRYITKALMNLRESMGVKFELGQLLVLAKIYEKGERGVPMVDLTKELKVGHALIGRNVTLFSAGPNKEGAHRNMVEVFYDPAHPRSKSVRMTEEGKELLSAFLGDMRPYYTEPVKVEAPSEDTISR